MFCKLIKWNSLRKIVPDLIDLKKSWNESLLIFIFQNNVIFIDNIITLLTSKKIAKLIASTIWNDS